MTINQFIAERAKETYPEPRSEGHDQITLVAIDMVKPYLPERAHILDVGCGQGPAAAGFEKLGHTSFGITTNQDDNEFCNKNGIWVGLLDMHTLPEEWTGKHFDLIWARHVLEHSIAPFYVLSEFARILKPGGILYAEMPAPDTVCLHDCNNPNHYSVLGSRMWQSLIKRSGFEILHANTLQMQTAAGPDLYLSYICRKE